MAKPISILHLFLTDWISFFPQTDSLSVNDVLFSERKWIPESNRTGEKKLHSNTYRGNNKQMDSVSFLYVVRNKWKILNGYYQVAKSLAELTHPHPGSFFSSQGLNIVDYAFHPITSLKVKMTLEISELREVSKDGKKCNNVLQKIKLFSGWNLFTLLRWQDCKII